MRSGPAIAFARRRVGLSQVALARALHMSPAQLRDLERGDHLRASLSSALAEAIAAALVAARLEQARHELERRQRVQSGDIR